MFRGRSVAIVLPALDEEECVGSVVSEFRAQPSVDRVLVVDNGSRDRTAERARAAGAEVLPEPRRGYGAALRAGLEHGLASGAELLVLAESDGTFDAGEIERLLAPLESHALVLGSRRCCTALPRYQRLGNRVVACLLAGLWPRTSARLTDVGCTYRALRAQAWRDLRPGVNAAGPEFSPEMICEAFALGLATLEIPIACRRRAGGESKHTGSPAAALGTALRMLRAIARKRITRRSGPGPTHS